MAGFRILDDEEQSVPAGGFRILADDPAPQMPVRFMEEPTALERVLAGVKLPGWLENLRGTAPVRVLQGMADPMIGAMQTAANVLPDATGIPQAVNKRVADLESDYEAQRRAMTPETLSSLVTGKKDAGTDWARLGGNVLSPVNAIAALRVAEAPAAVTNLGRAWQGAKMGAGMAAVQPIADGEGGFWKQKAGETVLGAATGGVLAPILGKVGDAVVRRFAAESPQALAARSSAQTDVAINDALKELGQTIHDIPPAQLQALREQVNSALGSGQQLNPAAITRQADFNALGMKPTLGQITRDPMQFAREQNLRGVEGVGEPIAARLSEQGRQLQDRLSAPAAGARDPYTAGNALSESLAGVDDKLRGHVSGLYREARASFGKDLDVPLQGLAQDYARILGDFGDNVPGAIRTKLASLGLDPAQPSNQKKLFTLEDANALLQTINKNDPRHANPPMSTALAELRTAVKSAIVGADSTGGPFAPAVKAASERFKLHDAVPALKAAAEGSVAPDDFVRRFVVNGKTDEVKGLSQVLKQADPTAWQEARAQIGDVLKRAAFGENAAGDAPFAPQRYMQTVRKLGPDKLGAFFSTEEVADIMRVGRVGAYIKQAPNASAVSTSNSNIGLINVMARVPGLSGAAGVANRVASTVQNNATVRNALAAQVPAGRAPLSEMQRNYLSYLLALGTAEGGGLAARAAGQ